MSKQPSYRIRVDGVDISPRINGRLISLVLTDNRGIEADDLQLSLSDHDGQLAIPAKGARIQLLLGWDGGALVDKGEYLVDEVTHSGAPDQLAIRARSADFRASLKVKREQSWHDTSLQAIVTALAERNQLEPVIGAPLGAIAVAHIDQTQESDINFLTRLAALYGATAAVKAGRLLFITQGSGTTASGQPIAPATLTRGDGDQHHYQLADRDSQYSGVQANWNDKRYAFLKAEIAGVAGNLKVLRHSYRSATEARAAAAAEWSRIRRQAASFKLNLALGNPSLYPETPVRVRGFKEVIDATAWLLVRVVHELDDGGYRNRLELETQEQQGA
tara:strand:+ start:923 stop:1918 length:996 start_codon:yes stop_codon:yes gene_type:complete